MDFPDPEIDVKNILEVIVEQTEKFKHKNYADTWVSVCPNERYEVYMSVCPNKVILQVLYILFPKGEQKADEDKFCNGNLLQSSLQ